VELTVLGADGTYPRPRSACSGYLLQHDGFSLWMDAGNGTLSFLQEHIEMSEIDAVFISHAHVDHCADIYPFFYALLNERRTVPLYTAPRVRDKLEWLIGQDSRDEFGELFDWTVLEPGDVTEVGPFRLEAFDAAHSTANVTLRAQTDGKTFCYSGDTGPNPELVRAARGADLFLCEASWLEKDEGLMPPIHLKAAEAGQAASEADVGHLMLTHVWPINPLNQIREEASTTFSGTIEFARDVRRTKI
jgi:ribonuclease BN (tRNA processing enzyme)